MGETDEHYLTPLSAMFALLKVSATYKYITITSVRYPLPHRHHYNHGHATVMFLVQLGHRFDGNAIHAQRFRRSTRCVYMWVCAIACVNILRLFIIVKKWFYCIYMHRNLNFRSHNGAYPSCDNEPDENQATYTFDTGSYISITPGRSKAPVGKFYSTICEYGLLVLSKIKQTINHSESCMIYS